LGSALTNSSNKQENNKGAMRCSREKNCRMKEQEIEGTGSMSRNNNEKERDQE
jgi:hypothetical protein